jgi:hypothetical protein
MLIVYIFCVSLVTEELSLDRIDSVMSLVLLLNGSLRDVGQGISGTDFHGTRNLPLAEDEVLSISPGSLISFDADVFSGASYVIPFDRKAELMS